MKPLIRNITVTYSFITKSSKNWQPVPQSHPYVTDDWAFLL